MKNKKEITIEDLAGMVQKGFLEINGKFEKIDNRFDKIDKRFEKLEKGQKEIIEKLDKKADKFEVRELGHRIETLELKASWGK
ncbi:MAG: hypothetical protein Q7U36_00190 [bacterium]|nr:hypothetical protein [bacterium]